MDNILYLEKSRGWAGAESSLAQLIAYLTVDSYRTHILFDFPMKHQLAYPEVVKKHYRADNLKWWMGSDYWKRPVRGSDYVKRLVFSQRLKRVIRNENVSILHINLLRNEYAQDIKVARREGLKIVGHVRSLLSQVPFNPKLLDGCDVIISTSQYVADEIQSLAPRKQVAAIYDPVEASQYESDLTTYDARLELGLPLSGRVLSSIAMLDPRKGHDVAIQAFSYLIQKSPDLSLLIVGSGHNSKEEKERLVALAMELDVMDRVRFLGHVQDIRIVYAASDLIYALSIDGEAFGRVPLEAAAASKPVVASRSGATPEIVNDRETGLLVSPGSVSETVAATKTLLNDPVLSRQISMAARHHVFQFSPEVHAAQIELLYKSLLGAHG